MRYLSLLAAFAVLAGFTLSLSDQAGANEPSAAGWGTIKGQVIAADGANVVAKRLAVTKDQEHCLSKGPLFADDWVVNSKNCGVRYAFVWLAPVPGNGAKLPVHPKLAKMPEQAAEMDQPCCQFVPHVLGIREGQLLIVKNSAPIAHNVNYAGGLKNPSDNKLVATGGKLDIKNLKASHLPIQFKCDIHPWMKGWVRVFDHPYFAITDENGDFVIKDAPAGAYHLGGWHEAVGWLNGGKEGKPITIKADGEVKVSIEAKPAE